MKILIVEDNTELAWLLAERLKGEGYRTLTAGSGSEGIKAALSFLPDLILLDYNLGDMTGHDVAVALRNTHRTAKIPFLVLSAHGADPMLARGFARMPNCRGAMSKVLSTKDVLKAVHKALPAGGKAASAPEPESPAGEAPASAPPPQKRRGRLGGKIVELIKATPVYKLLRRRGKGR